MIQLSGLISSLLLVFIGVLHFYWAFGGTWAAQKVIPTKEDNKKVLMPSWYITAFVGLVVLFFALIYAVKSGVVRVNLPSVILKYGLKVLIFIFIARAIGEFNYVGFFKKIKDTTFAKNDTKLYSPLCLFLGVVGLLIEFY